MDHLFAVQYSYLIPLLPLLGAALAGFLGAKWLKGQSHWPIWLGVGASAVISISLLVAMLGMSSHGEKADGGKDASAKVEHEGVVEAGTPKSIEQVYALTANKDWFTWIQAGNFKVSAGFWFDPLTAVMLTVVCGIGFFITVFAAGYMKGEKGYFRFFAYLGLFIFAMTCLVMGNNFVMLYLGWEGVGLCSYLLIGYYYTKPAAREAAKKAFLVNRVGDFGFGLGIMLIYMVFGNVGYFSGGQGVLELAANSTFLATLPAWKQQALEWIPFCLMLGAFGKSAQFPLYVWLPDAMEGPTPVSALIHAATMVTAGVYMIARCGTLFVGNEAALMTIAFVGAFTALFAGSIALRQFDLKKVFAYSTVSQLGFMFVGVGVLAPVPAVFHLVTHAFFKALLFLSSGVVMHAMLGHLDMRKMSGLKRVLPWTHRFMLVGCLALAGFPFFSGFFSKDEIVAAAWHANKFLAIMLLMTALMTAYYTFRLYFRVFQGPELVPSTPAEDHAHDDDHVSADAHGHDHAADAHAHDAHGHDHGHHNHEPILMILPLFVLMIGALLAGYINWPERHSPTLGSFLGQSPSLRLTLNVANVVYGGHVDEVALGGEEPSDPGIRERAHALHMTFMIVSGLISALGIYLAYLFHLKYRERGDNLAASFPSVARVLEAKYWVDEIYQAAIVEPLRSLGRVFFAIDRFVVDGLVWAVSFVPQLFGFTLKLSTQRGSLQGYAVVMLLGVATILLVVFWPR